MIKYLKHNEINKQKWDDCISQSFNSIIYAYSWYLDIVCKEWEALVKDDYKTVMPLTASKKYGFHYLYPPFFTQQLGVFSTSILNENIVKIFIEAIPSKFKFFEINLNLFNKFNSSGYQVKSNITCELDLIDSYENIFRKYSENTKRNIKKAITNDLTIEKEIDIEKIINLFRKNKGKDITNLQNHHYHTLAYLVKSCQDRGKSIILGIQTKEKQLCAGAIFIADKSKVIFLFSATNDEAKSNGAMSFLIDHFIKENSQRNIILDFEGSNDPDLARFYKSFGSKECTYLQVKINQLPWYIRWLKK